MPVPKFGFASPKVAKIAAMLAKKGKIKTPSAAIVVVTPVPKIKTKKKK